ncbi:hypothetical protein J6590_073501 [Homalodisca vitripennis]|nr:hypothetical protein J6590_073501 [Homalodisca vitripennis]
MVIAGFSLDIKFYRITSRRVITPTPPTALPNACTAVQHLQVCRNKYKGIAQLTKCQLANRGLVVSDCDT